MLKKSLILLTVISYTAIAIGQSGPYLFSGASYMSNGEIGILADDAEAAIVLPALLAQREFGGWTVGASKRSGLSDYTEAAGAAHLKLPWKDQLALGIQHAGIDGYSEQRISLSYARRLFDKLNAGVTFDMNRNSAEEYDDLYAVSWAISVHAPLMKQLSIGAYIYNPLGVESDLDLPSLIRADLLYTPSAKLELAMEVEKDWRHEVRFKAGFNYHLHQRLAIRWGVSTSPSLVHAGLSWNILNNMALSGGWRYHSKLGSSLGASLSSSKNK
jgi:long-subunit fatty acid transport protein